MAPTHSSGPSVQESTPSAMLGVRPEAPEEAGSVDSRVPSLSPPRSGSTMDVSPGATAALRGEVVDNVLLGQKVAEAHMRYTVTQDLFRIYHDSMENNLACWVTEQTCPYSVFRNAPGTNAREHMPSVKWRGGSAKWEDRFCAQACLLDRAYSHVRERKLTAIEEKNVSHAFHKAIMAFAMQWARRKTDRGLKSPNSGIAKATEDCWNEAYRSLQICAGVESIRVLYACLIFGLTARPRPCPSDHELLDMARMDEESSPFGVFSSQAPSQRKHAASIPSVLQELLDADQATEFLEHAARQLRMIRNKLEERKIHRGSCAAESHGFGTHELDTFNLIFWMGVVFETVHSPVFKRPIVITEEDCAIHIPSNSCAFNDPLPSYSSSAAAAAAADELQQKLPLWGDMLLQQRAADVDARKIEPGSFSTFEDIAEIISEAATIKTLLFRRVSQLQASIREIAPADRVERFIQETLRVIGFWDRSYGQHMKQYMQQHDSLLPRLQSWYCLILGHWQLGVLLFCEAVEEADQGGLSPRCRLEHRETSQSVTRLRMRTALAACNLAKACLHTHKKDPTSVEPALFHDVFQPAALLFEPSTTLLVRLFTKAALLLIDEISEDECEYMMLDPSKSLIKQHVNLCIKALECVGAVTNVAVLMASHVSQKLTQAISGAR